MSFVFVIKNTQKTKTNNAQKYVKNMTVFLSVQKKDQPGGWCGV